MARKKIAVRILKLEDDDSKQAMNGISEDDIIDDDIDEILDDFDLGSVNDPDTY